MSLPRAELFRRADSSSPKLTSSLHTRLEAKKFRNNIRYYNNSLAFSSLGATIDKSVTGAPGGPPTFRISGELCHLIGSLLPPTGTSLSFAQVYVSDPQEAHKQRLALLADAPPAVRNGVDPNTLKKLEDVIHRVNPYAKLFRMAKERVEAESEDQTVRVRLQLINPSGRDSRTYNAPTVDEVGIIMVGSGEEEDLGRDLIVETRAAEGPNGRTKLKRVSEIHRSYAPLRRDRLHPPHRSRLRLKRSPLHSPPHSIPYSPRWRCHHQQIARSIPRARWSLPLDAGILSWSVLCRSFARDQVEECQGALGRWGGDREEGQDVECGV